MEEEDMTGDQSDQVDSLKRKRQHADEEHDPNVQAVPIGSVAAKATGKPVLNTKALRSVLKGMLQHTCNLTSPGQVLPEHKHNDVIALLMCLERAAVYVVQAVPNYAQPW